MREQLTDEMINTTLNMNGYWIFYAIVGVILAVAVIGTIVNVVVLRKHKKVMLLVFIFLIVPAYAIGFFVWSIVSEIDSGANNYYVVETEITGMVMRERTSTTKRPNSNVTRKSTHQVEYCTFKGAPEVCKTFTKGESTVGDSVYVIVSLDKGYGLYYFPTDEYEYVGLFLQTQNTEDN